MLQTVKTLCALPGVSGWEDEVRDYILERVMPLADRIETDPMGNLYVFKKGAVTPDEPVMVCAHMDEVGLIVTRPEESGHLRIGCVGGVDRRVLLGKRVFVGPDALPGVIGLKPKHLSTEEERIGTVPALDALSIDIGCESAEEAEKLVRPGSRAVFDPTIYEFGEGYLKAKALDDRVGCAAMLKLLEQELPVDTWFVFTVQEEVGCRGAGVAAERLRPGIAVVLEGTTAADIGGAEPGKEVCVLGKGVVVPFMDRGTIYDRGLWETVTAAADRNAIPWQNKTRIAGGTDGSAIQRRGNGARVVGLAVPLRSIHSPASVGRIGDLLQLPALCGKLLEELAHGY